MKRFDFLMNQSIIRPNNNKVGFVESAHIGMNFFESRLITTTAIYVSMKDLNRIGSIDMVLNDRYFTDDGVVIFQLFNIPIYPSEAIESGVALLIGQHPYLTQRLEFNIE